MVATNIAFSFCIQKGRGVAGKAKQVVQSYTDISHGDYKLNVCVPRNSYVEALTPNVMALGDGALGM